jgi:hypothetical protein
VSFSSAAGGQPNKRLIALVLAVIAVLFIILGIIYLAVPAGSLPSILGKTSAAYGHHTKRMIASFVIGVVLLGAAWFVNRGGKSKGSSADSTPVDASRSK